MVSSNYNLDDSIQEYFTFTIGGHNYRFRHMNTEEVETLKGLEGDEDKSRAFLYDFISTEDEKAPAFPEVAKTMIVPHWIKFRKMLQTEFGG